MIAWCPYALAAIYSAFLHYIFNSLPQLSPALSTIPALFAKSSLVWPAVFNLILLNKERKKFLDGIIEEGSKLLLNVQYSVFKKEGNTIHEEKENSCAVTMSNSKC